MRAGQAQKFGFKFIYHNAAAATHTKSLWTMVKPSSPTAALTEGMASLRGKRTGIRLANKGEVPVENGMEDPESFWEGAKTPREKPEAAENNKSEVKAKQRLKDKNAEKPEMKPRFSLAGQESEEGEDKAADKAEHILKHVKGAGEMSPSEMSRVSTAPPTPASAITQHDEPPEEEVPYSPPEEVRASPEEKQEEEAVVPQASGTSPTVGTLPAANDAPEEDTFPVDDEDDMIPPPPPEAEDADLSIREDEVPATQDEVDFPADVDDDDDDDDKEGAGFAIVHDPETPESVRAEHLKEEQKREEQEKKKKGRRKKKDTSSVAAKSTKSSKSTKSTAKMTRPRRTKKKVTIAASPLGYPAGNREYEVVPVSDFKDSPEDDGLRRSRRAKVKPLAFWKNERPLYEAHHETGVLGEAMGLMPVVAGYVSAQPTPYKKRKAPPAAASNGNGKKKAKKGSAASVADVEVTPFDSRKLRKVRLYVRGLFIYHFAVCLMLLLFRCYTEIQVH